MTFLIVAALTLGFQAAYVYGPEAGVLRKDGYDVMAHLAYFRFVRQGLQPALAFRDSYVWIHFPAFYQWNSLFADLVCGRGGGLSPCMWDGVRLAWFFQAVLRVAALGLLFLTFRRLCARPWVAAAALALAATTPRMFFTTCIWNQDEYVFFFAVVCMYLTVAAVQSGLSWPRVLAMGLAVGLGFAFKLTILIAAMPMCLTLLLLPRAQATPVRKLAALGWIALCVVAINWELLTTRDGLERVFWTGKTQYAHRKRNSQDLVGTFLTVDPRPWLRPDPIYVRNIFNALGQDSFTTAAYLYVFVVYDHFQGPRRNWLNLLCVWTGTPLFVAILVRMTRTGVGLVTSRGPPLEEVHATALVALSALGIVYMSLGFPWGWVAHPEYVIAAYPAAALLALRQIEDVRRPRLRTGLWVVAMLHLAANVAMLVHTGLFKIARAAA
jgi:4-amino-4-deoxy-L-arabinose transferase-like glycosyltransferase